MLSMFNVPFAIFDCVDWELKKQALDELSQLQQVGLDMPADSSVATDFHKNRGKSYCDEVAQLFEKEINAFYNQLQITAKMLISQAWFQFASKGMHHPVHNHSAVGYSAICYMEFNPDLHTGTTFIAPYHNFLNGQVLEFTPPTVEGMIIFFPSVIHHYAIPNQSDVTRKIISFNLVTVPE